MKTLEECSSYKECAAPLCPLSGEQDDCVWYPGEEVCMARKFTSLHWVRTQKRLRKYKVKDAGYFTRKMLNDTRRCTPATKGINPEGRIAKGHKVAKEPPIPLPQSCKKPLKTLQGHCRGRPRVKERQLAMQV